MNVVMGAIGAARSVRSEHGLERTDKVPLELRAADPAVRELLEQQRVVIERLVITDSFKIEAPGGARPRGAVVSVAGDVEVLVGLLGLVDAKKEKERVERMLKKVKKDIEVMEKRLANPKFVESAPPRSSPKPASSSRSSSVRKRTWSRRRSSPTSSAERATIA